MKDLPGDQVRALPMLISGRLRVDRVRQTSKNFELMIGFDVDVIIIIILIILLLLLLWSILILCNLYKSPGVFNDQGEEEDRHLASY